MAKRVDGHDEKPVVAPILRVFAQATTAPTLVTCTDGSRWIVKLAGVGPGPVGLLTEMIAARVAAALGVPTPSARPLWLPYGNPWQVGTDEFDEMLQRSFGRALGIRAFPGAEPATTEDLSRASAAFVAALRAADRLLQNVDRIAQNPNIRRDEQGVLHAIGHDACLFLSRALAGRDAVPVLPANHPFADRVHKPMTSDLTLARPAILVDVPDAWLSAAGMTQVQLIDALATYEQQA